jgi:hypothetical protein
MRISNQNSGYLAVKLKQPGETWSQFENHSIDEEDWDVKPEVTDPLKAAIKQGGKIGKPLSLYEVVSCLQWLFRKLLGLRALRAL